MSTGASHPIHTIPPPEQGKDTGGYLERLDIGQEAEDILVLGPRKFLTDEDTVAVIGYSK